MALRTEGNERAHCHIRETLTTCDYPNWAFFKAKIYIKLEQPSLNRGGRPQHQLSISYNKAQISLLTAVHTLTYMKLTTHMVVKLSQNLVVKNLFLMKQMRIMFSQWRTVKLKYSVKYTEVTVKKRVKRWLKETVVSVVLPASDHHRLVCWENINVWFIHLQLLYLRNITVLLPAPVFLLADSDSGVIKDKRSERETTAVQNVQRDFPQEV